MIGLGRWSPFVEGGLLRVMERKMRNDYSSKPTQRDRTRTRSVPGVDLPQQILTRACTHTGYTAPGPRCHGMTCQLCPGCKAASKVGGPATFGGHLTLVV